MQWQGWVEAGSLGIGTSIVRRAGPLLSVQSVTWHRARAQTGQSLLVGHSLLAGKPYTVYNLTVEDDHTFFVGSAGGGTWVHNTCPGTNAQFGKKFADHREDYPGMNHEEYRNLADNMYDDSAATRVSYPANEGGAYAGETHIIRGSNLLRLDPAGNFRSLYPGINPATGGFSFLR